MSRVRTVVILAAGQGRRLRPFTTYYPKTLVRIGGLTILDRIMVSLNQLEGLEEIVIVDGYECHKLRRYIQTHTSQLLDGIKVRFIYNEKFQSYNNIYSFWLAVKEISEDLILLNSDIIFHPSILSNLFYSSMDNILVVDKTKKLGYEEMKVKVVDGFIKDISKRLPEDDACGEYIGMLKISRSIMDKVTNTSYRLLQKGQTSEYYEEALAVVARYDNVFLPMYTGNLAWTEIDTKHDLYLARKELLHRTNIRQNY